MDVYHSLQQGCNIYVLFIPPPPLLPSLLNPKPFGIRHSPPDRADTWPNTRSAQSLNRGTSITAKRNRGVLHLVGTPSSSINAPSKIYPSHTDTPYSIARSLFTPFLPHALPDYFRVAKELASLLFHHYRHRSHRHCYRYCIRL